MTIKEILQAAVGSTVAIAYLAGAIVAFAVTIPLAVSTAKTYLHQSSLRSAATSYARDEPEAADLLRSLRGKQRDPTAGLILGALEYNAATSAGDAETAVRLFTEALEIAPGRTAAVVGLACAKLRLAELSADGDLAAAAEDAAAILGQASDGSHPDVLYLRAALLVLEGKADQAADALAEDPATAPSLAGQRARWSNLTVAQILANRPALESAARAFTLRRLPLPDEQVAERDEGALGPGAQPAQILRAAYRFSLSDPRCQPSTPEALAERGAYGARLLDLKFTASRGARSGQYGRYTPHREESAEVMNAVGQALFRGGNYREAVAPLRLACALSHDKEPTFLLNLGQAAALAVHRDDKLEKEVRRTLKGLARDSFSKVVKLLSGKKEQQALLKLAIDNSLSLMDGSDADGGAMLLRRNKKVYPSEPDWNRNLGAMLDWKRKSGCLVFYRRALELGHPDEAAIRERVRLHDPEQK